MQLVYVECGCSCFLDGSGYRLAAAAAFGFVFQVALLVEHLLRICTFRGFEGFFAWSSALTWSACHRCRSGFVLSGVLRVSLIDPGPALSIDTACSSSLSGASMIADMLRRERCGRGLLTAALLTLDPHTIAMLAAAAMLAPDGRCKTLDSAADG